MTHSKTHMLRLRPHIGLRQVNNIRVYLSVYFFLMLRLHRRQSYGHSRYALQVLLLWDKGRNPVLYVCVLKFICIAGQSWWVADLTTDLLPPHPLALTHVLQGHPLHCNCSISECQCWSLASLAVVPVAGTSRRISTVKSPSNGKTAVQHTHIVYTHRHTQTYTHTVLANTVPNVFEV